MTKPTEKQIKSETKKLRKIIDGTKDPLLARIAYAVETALLWSIIDASWESPSADVIEEAKVLKSEIDSMKAK